jgi:hypothetical protein
MGQLKESKIRYIVTEEKMLVTDDVMMFRIGNTEESKLNVTQKKHSEKALETILLLM